MTVAFQTASTTSSAKGAQSQTMQCYASVSSNNMRSRYSIDGFTEVMMKRWRSSCLKSHIDFEQPLNIASCPIKY